MMSDDDSGCAMTTQARTSGGVTVRLVRAAARRSVRRRAARRRLAARAPAIAEHTTPPSGTFKNTSRTHKTPRGDALCRMYTANLLLVLLAYIYTSPAGSQTQTHALSPHPGAHACLIGHALLRAEEQARRAPPLPPSPTRRQGSTWARASRSLQKKKESAP